MAQTESARLYGYYRSSTSYRTRIALNLKGIAFEHIDIRLDRGAQLESEFTAMNPMNAVPVLEMDSLRLIQSPAILEYLEEQYPDPRLLPTPTPARQRVRELAALVGCDIHPVNNLRVLKFLRSEHHADDQAIATWYRHWINAGFAAYETLLTQTDRAEGYCVGETTSLAEVFLIPQIYNASRFEVDMTPYPEIASIDSRCASDPAFSAAHPDRFKP